MAKGTRPRFSTFSMTEPQGGSDPKVFTTRAIRDGDDWINSRFAFTGSHFKGPHSSPFQGWVLPELSGCVIPAKAGIQQMSGISRSADWMPACAGMPWYLLSGGAICY